MFAIGRFGLSTTNGACCTPRNPDESCCGPTETKFGSSKSFGADSQETAEPNVGWLTVTSGGYAVWTSVRAREWLPSFDVMLRMTAKRCICAASFGRCSPRYTPGIAVATGLNGPPVARPGLGSNVSRCDGPPCR